MLTPDAAEKLIGQHLKTLPAESLPLAQCAGAILRQDIHAERDQPPFDRVTMDGIAIRSSTVHSGTRRLSIEGMQAAGDPPRVLAKSDACIEIMTGAVLPSGCDAVIPVEQLLIRDGVAQLAPDVEAIPGQNIHRRASDTREGTLLLRAGKRLTAPEVAIAASAGLARVQVSSQPTIIAISTGNELIEPGEPILPHQIRRSNVYGVTAALREHGFHRVADDHVPDNVEHLRSRLKTHLETHDVMILSGGVSMGQLDLVPRVLGELGVREVFHRVAQRPGKPLWFGVAASGGLVFALPGNPVSTLVCLSRYVIPALFTAMGQTTGPPRSVALGKDFQIDTKLTFFLPVRIESDEALRPWAIPCLPNGSGDFTSLAATDGFIELPPGQAPFSKGFVSRFYQW